MSLEHRDRLRLHLCVARGSEAPSVRLLPSDDFEQWSEAERRTGPAVAQGGYAHPVYGSQEAHGLVELGVDAASPGVLGWRCAMEPDGGRLRQGVVWRAGEGERIADLLIRPGLRSGHAAVVEVVTDAARELRYAHTPWIDRLDVPPRPLPGGEGVSCVRLVERGRGRWLVTLLRQGRLEWGEIDWEGDAALQPLHAAPELKQALERVGLA